MLMLMQRYTITDANVVMQAIVKIARMKDMWKEKPLQQCSDIPPAAESHFQKFLYRFATMKWYPETARIVLLEISL